MRNPKCHFLGIFENLPKKSYNIIIIIIICIFRLGVPDNEIPFTILHTPTRILLGGSDGHIHQFKNNGQNISSVATSSAMVYSLTVTFIYQKNNCT